MTYYIPEQHKKCVQELVGKTVVGIDIAGEESALRFRCQDRSVVIWAVYGDCCSESWWADAFELNSLRNSCVVSAEVLEMPELPDDDTRTRQEYDEVYGFKIKTWKGETKLAFRNSSNGYYGGEMTLAEKDDKYTWREIEGNDWSA